MTETPATPPSSEARTGPIVPTTVPVEPRHRTNRLTFVAAWVGIVAGVVFIVAVVFGTGYVLGAHSGGQRGGGGHGPGPMMIHRDGPPPFMFPMGPRGQFEFPGPDGPGAQGPGAPAPQPGAPTTTAAPRP